MSGPGPIDPSLPPIPPSSDEPPLDEGGPPLIQGAQDTMSTSPPLPDSFFRLANAFFRPPGHITLGEYLDALDSSRAAFRGQLSANRLADRELEGRFREAVVGSLEFLFTIRAQLTQLYQQATQLLNGINEEIDEINASLNTDSSKTLADVAAIQAFNQSIEEFNEARQALQDAIDTDTVTQEMIDDYNLKRQAYIDARSTYVTYATQRNQEIAVLNGEIADYNAGVGANNQAIGDVNAEMSEFAGLPLISSQQMVNPPEIASLPDAGDFPVPPAVSLDTLPAQLPDAIGAINVGAYDDPNATVPNLSFPASESDFINSVNISTFLPSISLSRRTAEFFRAQDRFDPDDELESLRKLLVPPAFIPQQDPARLRHNAESGQGITLALVGLEGHPEVMERIISKQLILQVIRDQNLRLSPADADRVQALAASILGINVQKAIPIGYSVLGSQLRDLDSSDPAISVAFALALNSQILQRVNAESVDQLVSELIDLTPSLQGISEEQKAALQEELAKALSLSLLLTVAGLLGRALGLPDLLTQLAATLSLPPGALQNLPQNGGLPEGSDDAFSVFFQNRGIGKEEADILASVSVSTVDRGFLTPFVLPITAASLDSRPLEQSIVSGLIFKGYTADEAQRIASQALPLLLTPAAKYTTVPDFRAELVSQLEDLGVKASVAEQVAGQVFLVGNLPNPLDVEPGSLSSEDLQNVIQERAIQLLTPSLGKAKAGELAAEVSRSLIGDEEKFPISTLNVTRDQLRVAKEGDEERYTNLKTNLFRDKLSLSRERYVFDQHVLDPANLLLLMYKGDFYGGIRPRSWKKMPTDTMV